VIRENAGATPHPACPPTAGIHVGNVNKSIIADTVQNSQDVNFGNLYSLGGEIALVGHTDNVVESTKGGGAGFLRGGVDQSILAGKVVIQGDVKYTSSKAVFPFSTRKSSTKSDHKDNTIPIFFVVEEH
jgi:hypothetical protein